MKNTTRQINRDPDGRPMFRAKTWSKSGKGKCPKQGRRNNKASLRNW